MGSSLSLGGKAAQKGWYVNQASKNESLSFLELDLLLNISSSLPVLEHIKPAQPS